jgi:hypothetical protein
MIAPGALVMVRQTGIALYGMCGRADDGIRWRLRGKRDDARGRSDVTCRVAGAGDLVLIRPAPTYDRTHDEEQPEHSRIRFVTITEQEDLRQRGLL